MPKQKTMEKEMSKKISIMYTLNKAMDEKIVNTLNNLLNDYMERHCKTFVMRLDVHLPKEMQQDGIMKFNHRFIEKEKNAGFDPVYAMARELSSKNNIHYHMALFLNGNKTKSIFKHIKNAETVLQHVVGEERKDEAWIERCNKGHRNGILLNRNNLNSYDLQEVQRQISYLAKIEQKEGIKGKRYFTSKKRNK